MEEREIRQRKTNIEVRAATDNSGEEYIEGYALKFEKWSEELGWFREIINRTALDKTDTSDVFAAFNHNEDYPLARNTVTQAEGKLELAVDNIGLKFRFKPTNTSYANDLKENVRAGVINQCSFVFSLDYTDEDCEEWSYNEELKIYERRLNKIARIYEISLVTTPAYSDTEAVIGQRSRIKADMLKEERHKPIESEIEKLKVELDLLELQ